MEIDGYSRSSRMFLNAKKWLFKTLSHCAVYLKAYFEANKKSPVLYVVLIALFLRLWGIGFGLPEYFFYADEWLYIRPASIDIAISTQVAKFLLASYLLLVWKGPFAYGAYAVFILTWAAIQLRFAGSMVRREEGSAPCR